MKDLYKNKNVLIFGLGLNDGGLGMTEFFVGQGANVTVTDNKTASDLQATLDKLAHYTSITYHLGEILESDFITNDIIVQNPAIKPDNKYIQLARSLNKTIEMEMSLFHRLCPCPIIGITGTRGKSTTTALIYEMLNQAFGNRVLLGGNIGKSAIRELPKLTPDQLVVLELSSFQLDTMARAGLSPNYALITNIYEDHLNWHSDMTDYIKAKKTIFLYQHKQDVTLLNVDNEHTRSCVKDVPSTLLTFSLKDANATYYMDSTNCIYENKVFLVDTSSALLVGMHNKYNMLAAIALVRQFSVPAPTILEVLNTYTGLEGRQQFVREVNGIKYINDTTATSVEAMLALLDSYGKNYKKRLILISGGVDKGLDYARISQQLKTYCKAVVLFEGTASEKLSHILDTDVVQVESYFNSMQEALACATKIAVEGDLVVLCPGAASFNMFNNEFDRGSQFVNLVNKL